MTFFYSSLSLAARVLPLLVVITLITRNETSMELAQFLYALSFLSVLSASIEYGHTNSVVVHYKREEEGTGSLALQAKALNLLPYFALVLVAISFQNIDAGLMVKLAIYFVLFHVQCLSLILIRLQQGFRGESLYSLAANGMFIAFFVLFSDFFDPAGAMLAARLLSFIPLGTSVFRHAKAAIALRKTIMFLKFYKFSFFFFLTQALGLLMLNIDQLILIYLLPLNDFVTFGIANRYYIPLTMVSVAATPVLLALLTEAEKSQFPLSKIVQIGFFLLIFTAVVWLFFDDFLGRLLPNYQTELSSLHLEYTLIVFLRTTFVISSVALLVRPNRWDKMLPMLFAIFAYLIFVWIIRPGNLNDALTGTITMYLAALFAVIGLTLMNRSHVESN